MVISPVAPRQPIDPDAIGNRADSPTHLLSSSSVPTSYPTQQVSGVDDDMDEEDRQAYLRAQATQDAAIAQFSRGQDSGNIGNMRPGSNAGRHSHGGPGGGGRGDRGRRNRRGGHQGRGRDRNQRNRQAPLVGASKGTGIMPRSSVDQDSGGGGNSGGGDGGHSQPPTE